MCSSNTNKWVRERKRSTHSTAKPRPNRACSLILNIVPDDLPACSVATLTMWGESRWLGGMHTQNASRLQRKNPMSFLAFSLSSSLFVCVLWAQGSWILLGIYPDWLYWESLYAFWTGCLSLPLWKQLPSLRVFFWSLSDAELPSSNGRLSSHIPDWLWKSGLEARCCLFGRFAFRFLTEGSALA